MSMILDGSNGVTFNDASLQGAAASPYVLKNRIINGDMVIDQRNAGASITPTDTSNLTYNVDRWGTFGSASSKFTVQQNAGAVTPPAGFNYYIGVTSLSAYTVGAGEEFSVIQQVEGYNVADLDFGKATAKTITLSFWVRSSLTGTFGGSIRNGAANRSYAFSYTISVANTWEYKTVTIAGDTSGTWLTTNGIGFRVVFGLGVGASASTTAGIWTAGNFSSATGAVSVVGTNGATFYITGVQLEVGTTATPFERRLYNQELANCQRYYYLHVSGAVNKSIATAAYYSSTNASGYVQFPVQMRATPTAASTTGTDYYTFYRNAASDTFNSLNVDGPTQNSTQVYNNTEVSGTAGQAGYFYTGNASAVLAFVSEL
jgi:hypothetical protein